MLERLDIYTTDSVKKFFDLKEYQLDGTFSYCDISDIKELLDGTVKLIDKTIIARQKDNWRVLKKISQYEDGTLIRAASVSFYELRNLYSQIFYFICECKKQQVYYMPDISIIPEKIEYTNDSLVNPVKDIKLLYMNDNADIDMMYDKMMLVFFKYFHIGQIPINDAESVLYSYHLMSSVCSPREKIFYEFIKNVAFLYSTFIVHDRLNQFKEALDIFKREKAFYLTKTRKIDIISWLSSPRKENITNAYTYMNNQLTKYNYHKLLLLINRHLAYIDTVKNLDPNMLVTEQGA